ncbi:MAG: M48 family metalloprotease [Alphaproteobacteria bacterium]
MANSNAAQTDEELLERMRAYRVPGSGLNRAMEEIARQFGLEGSAEVFVSRSKAINASMSPTREGLRMVVTEPLLEVLGSSANGSASQELRGVIGHELGHIREGGLKPYLLGGFLPMLGLPVIAVAARHYIARAHEHQLPRHQAVPFIRQQADRLYDPLPDQGPGFSTPQQDTAMTSMAKDVAVGALGFGGGSLIARVNSNLLEHRCDRWGARAGSPEAMINSFRRMEKAMAERKLAGIRVPVDDPYKYGKAQGKVSQWAIDFLRSTIGSHPSHAARIEYLEKLAVETATHLR